MKFLNGFKTLIGVAGLVASTVAPKLLPAVQAIGEHGLGIIQGAAGILAVLGFAHKAEKRAAAEAEQTVTGRR